MAMNEIKCTCGNYESYGSTLHPGTAVAAMMPMDACVHCYEDNLHKHFCEMEALARPKDLAARLAEFKKAKKAKK